MSATTGARQPGGYMPALDGLRALAVIAVVIFHTKASFLAGGGLGVSVFFALSGFLITTLLLRERDLNGAVKLSRFYGRRALRLLPALLLVLGFVALCAAGGRSPEQNVLGILGSLLYVANWAGVASQDGLDLLDHTWSLSVEEQFYLLWPIVLLVAAQRYGRRGVAIAAICGALIAPALRYALWDGASMDRVAHGTDSIADQLLWGCALAALVGALGERPPAIRLLFWPAAAFLIGAAVAGPALTGLWTIGGLAAVGIASTIVVGRLALFDDGVTRAMSWRPLVWLGGISYGMYLWHFPIEVLMPAAIKQSTPAFVVVSLVATVCVAAASYYLVERPLQRRYHHRVATPRPAPAHVAEPAAPYPALAPSRGAA
jgi:peptidoglycan/LPS O-acetylase OafA/YrhL